MQNPQNRLSRKIRTVTLRLYFERLQDREIEILQNATLTGRNKKFMVNVYTTCCKWNVGAGGKSSLQSGLVLKDTRQLRQLSS